MKRILLLFLTILFLSGCSQFAMSGGGTLLVNNSINYYTGGNITTSGLTTNFLPVASSSNVLTDSNIYSNGVQTNITFNNDLRTQNQTVFNIFNSADNNTLLRYKITDNTTQQGTWEIHDSYPTGLTNSKRKNREYFRIYNADDKLVYEIGSVEGAGNTELRFFDDMNTKIGFPAGSSNYFAFINDVSEQWLGAVGDPTLYYNYFVGSNILVGFGTNRQTITNKIDSILWTGQYGSGLALIPPTANSQYWETEFTGPQGKGSFIVDNKALGFGGTSATPDTLLSWDGTNFIINTNNSGQNGLAYFSNNISTTGVITRTQVYDETILGESQDNYVKSKDLLDVNGNIDHTLLPEFVEFEVIDYDNSSLVYDYTNYCYSGLEDSIHCFRTPQEDRLINFVNQTNIYKTIYGTKTEFGRDLEKSVAKHEETIAGYTTNFRTFNNLTDFDTSVMSENYYTQSKTIDETKDYFKNFKDITKLKDKINHYAYETNIEGTDKDGLNMEQRIVELEGINYMLIQVLCDKNILKKSDNQCI